MSGNSKNKKIASNREGVGQKETAALHTARDRCTKGEVSRGQSVARFRWGKSRRHASTPSGSQTKKGGLNTSTSRLRRGRELGHARPVGQSARMRAFSRGGRGSTRGEAPHLQKNLPRRVTASDRVDGVCVER